MDELVSVTGIQLIKDVLVVLRADATTDLLVGLRISRRKVTRHQRRKLGRPYLDWNALAPLLAPKQLADVAELESIFVNALRARRNCLRGKRASASDSGQVNARRSLAALRFHGRSRWPHVDRQPPDDHNFGDMNMKMLIAAAAIGTVIAAPALAQSYDPDLGSGNVSGFTAAPAYAWSVDRDAFAQVVLAGSRTRSAHDAYNAVTPSGSPTAPQDRQRNARSTRETALLECSTKSRQYTETTWGDMQIHQFRTCMMQHGQPE